MNLILNRNKKPKSEKELVFNLPRINEFRLDNGLRILFVEKNNLPIIQLNLIIDAGARFDPPEKSGLAYLLSLLIDEGAGKWNALQLSDELERIGAIFSSFVDNDAAYLSLLILKENFKTALELFSAILAKPKLTEEDFEREKKKQTARILQMLSRPSYIADLIFEKNIFNGSTYSQPADGYIQTIEKIGHNDALEFYRKYWRVENSTLVVAGNIQEDELREMLEKKIGNWSNSNEVTFLSGGFNPRKKKILLIDKPNAPQSEIIIGHLNGKKNDVDYFSKLVFNSIFGGQFSSRLNSNLREDKGYTYGIHSSFLYNKIGGYFNVSTSVETKNTLPAIDEIIKEIVKVKEGVKEEEVNFAKAYLTKRFPSQFETFGQVAKNLSSLVLFDLPIDYFRNYIEGLRKVTVEDVNTVAREKILLDDLLLTIVGDRKKLEEKLKSLPYFEEVEIVELIA